MTNINQFLDPVDNYPSPTDGQPFYCETCGFGFDEYMACDSTECELESIEEAEKRMVRGKK